MLRLSSLIVSAFLLTACSYGETEFQIYSQAYDTQFVEGAKVLDRLGEAERNIASRQPSRRDPTREFDPDDALYVLDVGDPPLTAGLRQALDSLKSYNDALTGLASGTSAAALAANLSAAHANLDATVGALKGSNSGAPELARGVGTTFGKLLPAIELALKARGRAEFRAQLLATSDIMKELIETLRAGTPELFAVMRRSREGGTTLGSRGSRFSAEALKGLEDDRRLLSGWVILLDKTLLAMNGATKAVEDGVGSADLTDLVAATVDLKSTALAIKASKQ